MNILLLGGGGREHAIAWHLSLSPKLTQLFIAPGNAGTDLIGINVSIDIEDFQAIKDFVISEGIGMVLVGPEIPLVAGIHDFFLADKILNKIPIIGPVKKAAMLEGSKDFAKTFMTRNQIPTALYKSFDKSTLSEGYSFLEQLKPPYVLKADGLAAGKGVLIIDDLQTAKSELQSMLEESKFGAACSKVVVEEFLKGIEISVFILTDGKSYIIFPEAKDYKRIGEGDTGPNTGGMGSISPVPFADQNFMQKVEQQIIIPTMKGLQKENIIYKGFIFFGLINVEGEPMVIEYNARLGDPETESMLPRVKTDLIELFEHVANETLNEVEIEIAPDYSVAIMMVAQGYPGDYTKGNEIQGLNSLKQSYVFHAGTKFSLEKNMVLTNGGRVLAVHAFGKTLEQAIENAYKNVNKIHFAGSYFRNDIGFDLK